MFFKNAGAFQKNVAVFFKKMAVRQKKTPVFYFIHAYIKFAFFAFTLSHPLFPADSQTVDVKPTCFFCFHSFHQICERSVKGDSLAFTVTRCVSGSVKGERRNVLFLFCRRSYVSTFNITCRIPRNCHVFIVCHVSRSIICKSNTTRSLTIEGMTCRRSSDSKF